MSMFVDEEDMVRLTGFCTPRKQIEQLKTMGVPFRINGGGRPVVARTAIEGGKQPQEQRTKVTAPAFQHTR